jgi:hypothetical protein
VFFWSFCWTGVSGVPADDDVVVVVLEVDAFFATSSACAGFVGFDPWLGAVGFEPWPDVVGFAPWVEAVGFGA